MTNSFGQTFLRRDNDLVFNQLIGETTFQVQVTHECLGDVFGSDGTREGDEKALSENMARIAEVATAKALSGAASPILVMNTDF
ncbi:hypothetical protein WM29_22735 [Burkholderia ubonensis]|uniref:hypothetical protein n=1 Tax=Burkholderia ubonensis TaxID=101571 RepID=UPI0008422BC9|nr:hypothetical protein [Burkholderia ubonensis]AOK61952.1 hypothetical protein WM29_22735 [Burkholderia ubonensis]